MGTSAARKFSYGIRTLAFALCAGTLVSAQIPNAPPRPTCTALEGPGSCDWKHPMGIGPGVRVILSDQTGGHDQSKAYLRDALTRLSAKYGFTLTRINDVNDITDAYLQNARVIIFSNGDGDVGRSIPNATVRTRVENFVKQSGWGMIMVHAACAFITSWPFQQQACVQQYTNHNASGTQGMVATENRTIGGIPQGRANPYTSFLLAALPDSVRMSDEWYTWNASPVATTQVGGVPITNKIMLFKLNETGLIESGRPAPPAAPIYGADHHLAWTHTQGNGITLFQSFGHDDIYQQDGTRRAYGDSLLWREIRYVGKDWDTVSAISLVASKVRSGFSIARNAGSISLSFAGAPRVAVTVVDIAGHRVYARAFNGEKSAEIQGLKRGVYFVNLTSPREHATRKITLY